MKVFHGSDTAVGVVASAANKNVFTANHFSHHNLTTLKTMYTRILPFVFVIFASFNLFANDVDWRCEPADVGLESDVLSNIDTIVQRSLDNKKIPGCVVCIGRNGRAAFVRSYGYRKPVDANGAAVLMTDDTLFDMASLTKCIATTISVMILVDARQVNIDAPVRDYLTEFDTPEKNMITVRQLLTHTAGFVPDNNIVDYNDGIATAWKRLLDLKPINKPGTRYTYSDVSFQVLGQLVERVSGQDINEFSRKNIFEPLGMNDTGFLPNAELSKRAAPTMLDRPAGKVHDPRSFLTDGVAGHAGLFSTAKDITIFADMLAG
ncbi:MAG: beta-lactamase family protein, partial [Planctomycetaceae bacterium]|nr:beta-lactamase family protein [Planctomycetaceae bacterium]